MEHLIEYKEMREAIVLVRQIIEDLKFIRQTNTFIDIDVVVASLEDALDGDDD